MQLQALLATAGLLSAANAIQISSSTTFKLVANVTSGDLTPSVQSLELSDWTVGHGVCHYVTSLNSPGLGARWYANGTYSVNLSPGIEDSAGQFINNAGITVTPGGTATIPAARPVAIECVTGTEGVVIKQNEAGVPLLRYGSEGYGNEASGWMACPAEVLNTPVNGVVVGYRAGGQRRFNDCAEVSLVAVCVEGEGGEGAVEVPCLIEE